MKIVNLNISKPNNATEKLIRSILRKKPNSFKATRWQFLRNNQAYNPTFTGLIA